MAEQTPVVIVGAGPAGLAMGLSLAKYQVKSVIFERENEITHDPRGVYLNGDAVRILWDLGIREQFKDIGHEVKTVNFHHRSFANEPFFRSENSEDILCQSLPAGIAHEQPKLEAALIDQVQASNFCTLRRGCTVESHDLLKDGMTIHYTNSSNTNQSIKCAYLIGADGKTGIVRKHFLEPSAGIKMQTGIYEYEGTWVAANLHISLPTPETHPQFPLWKAGFTPERVYDLFWPKGWHFCNPPGKATASGRFGPDGNRMWRHEFAQPNWNKGMDSLALFWEHISPMISRSCDEDGVPFRDGPVAFPRDCIEIRHCRPYDFSHRVVDRWFDGRRILIGDAAHVFPPFGGEGIASGVRDAHQLAWRLALLIQSPSPYRNNHQLDEQLLTAWAAERRRGINSATTATQLNGKMCNEPESWGFYFFRHLQPLLTKLPFSLQPQDPRVVAEAKGLEGTEGGFFLPEFGGGGKLAQIFVEMAAGGDVRLSDDLLRHDEGGLLALLVLGGKQRVDEAKAQLKNARLSPSVLSPEPIIVLSDEEVPNQRESSKAPLSFRPTTPTTTGVDVRPAYNSHSYRDRLTSGSKTTPLFAILRPDFYVFALLPTAEDLGLALRRLGEMLSPASATAPVHHL